MISLDLDEPDDLLGRQDPFVHAVRIWSSLEAMRRHGWSEDYIRDLKRSMDAVLIRHRRVLMEQYLTADPVRYPNPQALLHRMGLEYWGDGQELAENDPEGEGHARRSGKADPR